MDFATKDSWVMEPPVKPSYRSGFVVAAKQSTKDFFYRFEVTYGLYVMEFWEKAVVYIILGLTILFFLWKTVIPLPLACFRLACFRLASHYFALEPKGFHSVLERSAQQELGGLILGTAIETFNATFNGSSHLIQRRFPNTVYIAVIRGRGGRCNVSVQHSAG
ncbi:multidrug mfs transporter [Diplodia corticola]|uniref:Multidrug mfs transporter n=1 Tax=Diplodia corticola TaxID=236234 RepID=A0A1J9QR55_9PEZI|nr:multidrug mfs transporter [Diplodia corticola]OJD30498.1 multidrug mfs transporter [Diplodia corticola]